MEKLYIDCDGVFFDDIEKIYAEFEAYHSIEPSVLLSDWLKKLDWERVLNESGTTDGAIESIRQIPIENLSFLTTVQSVEEAIAKVKYVRKCGLKNEIIFVPAGCEKTEVVSAKGNILVDDHKENLQKWRKAGGTAIQFHKTKEKGEFPIIDNLSKIHWIET